MPKQLLLIRHGESLANIAGRYQGQTYDTSLSPRGRKQAGTVAKILRNYGVTKVLTSPLKRTHETAEIIAAKNGYEVTVDPLLMEMSHGSWEGKMASEFDELEQAALVVWRHSPQRSQMPQGESFDQVLERCRQILAKLKQGEGTVVIVTHDVIIRILAAMALKFPYRRLWDLTLDNAGITTISVSPLKMISLNQNSHLNGLKADITKQAL